MTGHTSEDLLGAGSGFSSIECDANTGTAELPPHAAWAGSRGPTARSGQGGPPRAGPPLHRQGSPQLSSSLFSEPQTLSSRGGALGLSDSGHHSGHHSPVSSSRLSTAGRHHHQQV